MRGDAVSDVAVAQINELNGTLLTARLRMAEYLRTEAVPERDALTQAMGRLEAAAAAVRDGQVTRTDLSIPAVRAALAAAAEAATTAARLWRAWLPRSPRSRTAAPPWRKARHGPATRTLAQGGAAVLADIARSAVAASHARASEAGADFEAAHGGLHHAREQVAELTGAATDVTRIQRLGGALIAAIDALDNAMTGVQSAIVARGKCLDTLSVAVAQTEAATREAAATIIGEQRSRRTSAMAAQASLQRSVLWTATGACVLGVALATLLGLSITRPLERLAGVMAGLAEGDLQLAIPGTAARHEIGAMARTVEVFKAHALKQRQMEADEAGRKQRAEEEKHRAIMLVADDFEGAIAGVVQNVSTGAETRGHRRASRCKLGAADQRASRTGCDRLRRNLGQRAERRRRGRAVVGLDRRSGESGGARRGGRAGCERTDPSYAADGPEADRGRRPYR